MEATATLKPQIRATIQYQEYPGAPIKECKGHFEFIDPEKKEER